MKAKISKYKEREMIEEKLSFGRTKTAEGEMQLVLHCHLTMSEEEQTALNNSGVRFQEYWYLTPQRFEGDENIITQSGAMTSEGAKFVCKSPGVLREAEANLKKGLQKLHAIVQPMLGYQIEETYDYDPATHSAQQTDE